MDRIIACGLFGPGEEAGGGMIVDRNMDGLSTNGIVHLADPATRTARAVQLAERYPHAREALDFYRELIDFRGSEHQLQTLVARIGPQLLRQAAIDGSEPFPTFAERILSRQRPCYFHLVQGGFVTADGTGTRFQLFCGTCLDHWTAARGQCPNCDSASVPS